MGLDRNTALEVFAGFLDAGTRTVEQSRFVEMIVDELTTTGVMGPGRLYESPYTDLYPEGPDMAFADSDVDLIVDILQDVKATAVPTGGAA